MGPLEPLQTGCASGLYRRLAPARDAASAMSGGPRAHVRASKTNRRCEKSSAWRGAKNKLPAPKESGCWGGRHVNEKGP